MSEEIARKICEQMTDDIDCLCNCCRKNEKDKSCNGCRELAIKTILQENTQLKQSLENAQDIYKNSHKYTSECEDKVIELKSVLKEIRELVESYNLGKYDYSIPPIGISDLLKIIDKGIGE